MFFGSFGRYSPYSRTPHIAEYAVHSISAGLGLQPLLETFTLFTAARIVAARRVFEIGTFFGATTLNLALNIPDDGKIFTLDLDARAAVDYPCSPMTPRLPE
jgi:predicted O-methyltransferase YrrM